jgi:cytidyltransferase-like protein
VNIIKRAKLCGDYLVVGVCSDRLVTLHKKTSPIFSERERANLIGALNGVDEVYIYDNPDQTEALKLFNVGIFVVGDQFGKQGVDEHGRALAYCNDNKIPIIIIPRMLGISSSELKNRVVQSKDVQLIQSFWKHRGEQVKNSEVGLWQATSFTTSEELATERKERDFEYILKAINRVSNLHGNILELGCGVGRITREIAQIYNHVYALDYIQDFIDAAKIHTQQYNNITYSCTDASNFDQSISYDCCLIAGLFSYLLDDQIENLIRSLSGVSCIILKESVGTFGRYELRDHYSEQMQCNYTALYRSVEELVGLFASFGYIMKYSEVVEIHRKETHLRVLLFEKITV